MAGSLRRRLADWLDGPRGCGTVPAYEPLSLDRPEARCERRSGFNHGSWRELALSRIGRLIDRRQIMCDRGEVSPWRAALVADHLRRAIAAATATYGPWRGLISWWHGDDVEKTWRNIHHAEALLLESTSAGEFAGRLPRVYAYVARHLGNHPDWAEQVRALAYVSRRYSPGDTVEFRDCRDRSLTIGSDVRYFVVTLMRVAQRTDNDANTRIREYRNVLWAAVISTSVLACVIAVTAPTIGRRLLAKPPSPMDLTVPGTSMIMMLGILGATIAVLQTLPKLPSFEEPYSLRNPQLFLKASTGALTAFIGVELLLADLVPWVSAPAEGSQVAAAAIIFGYLQQFITRLIDKEADAIATAGRPYLAEAMPPARADTVRSV